MADEPDKPDKQAKGATLKFDSFAKEALRVVLEHLGDVEPQKEIATHPQLADLWFEPDPNIPMRTHPLLSLVVRMAQQPTLFEPFSQAPTIERTCSTSR